MPTLSPDANVETLPFRTIADLVREHAVARPHHPALLRDDEAMTYGQLDAAMDRVAASLQRDGLGPGDAIALCAWPSPRYAVVFLGALRAGVAVAPLAPSVTPASFAGMLGDADARLLFVDAAAHDALDGQPPGVRLIALDTLAEGVPFDDWLSPEGAAPTAVAVQPAWPFNIIYSSGTTGQPKGIVQSHAMRWAHVIRSLAYGYDATA